MPTPQEDIEFLKEYGATLFRVLLALDHVEAFRLCEEVERVPRRDYFGKRIADLADANGLDGSFLRVYELRPQTDPDAWVTDAVEKYIMKEIELVHQLRDKIRESQPADDNLLDRPLTKEELRVLKYMTETPHVCQMQADIDAGAEVSRTSLKTILPDFETKGWIHRPYGPRKGYVITSRGQEVYRVISEQAEPPQ
jgi:hypothetical protein